MENTIVPHKANLNFRDTFGKVLLVLSGVFLFIVALAIFQDFLESRRSGIDFNFDESVLFKTVWFLFIPILLILYKRLQNGGLESHRQTAFFIVLPIVAHLFILPFVAVLFSVLFFEGRYDLYKFFSYTLAHDFYKLVIIYTSFVLGYKFFSKRIQTIADTDDKKLLDKIVINNGKDNVIVDVCNIIQITSATPYIFIHLENKKYLHSETLKSICTQLDSNAFIRVHKSAVVNIKKVRSFTSRLNGDYDLLLTNGELVRLSRTYSTAFKNQFNASQRVKA